MNQRLNIVADANIPGLEATFGRHGEVQRLPGRSLAAAQLARADVLLVRSVTRVDEPLLGGSPVRFVGSATIGTDHLDTGWLEHQGIAWAAAPGCNADAAAQYSLAMLLLACRRLGRDYREQRVGIIGRGNVGSRLQRLLAVLGVSCVACDPPLEEQGEAGLVDLDEALAQDIVSLHVPLVRDGRWPTLRLMDERRLATMRPGAVLINAARGDVVDGAALLVALRGGRLHAALDTWPGEPDIDAALLAASLVASPHVAGYSLDGRLRGTAMVYAAWCDRAGVDAADRGSIPSIPPSELRCPPGQSPESTLLEAAQVAADDLALRSLLAAPGLAEGFDRLRRDYQLRRDHAGIQVRCAEPGSYQLLKALGFLARQDSNFP